MSSTSLFRVFEPSRAHSLYGLSIAVCVVPTVIICLRFWSRALLPKHKFRADDWTALMAWPFVVGTAICGAIAMRHGFGVHIKEIIATDPAVLPSIFKITYVGEITWTIGMGIIRSSAMLFYNRIFSRADHIFRRFAIGGIVANVLWSTILGFIVIFQCTPVKALWDTSVKGKCLETIKIELGSGISSIILDLYTLVLPMPILWKLQMDITKKVLTFGTFVLGYCVIVTTIGRTVSVVKTGDLIAQDFTWYFPNILYWVIIELLVAHVCISLPSVFMLFRRARQRGLTSLFVSRDASFHVNSEDHPRPRPMSTPHIRRTTDPNPLGEFEGSDSHLQGVDLATSQRSGEKEEEEEEDNSDNEHLKERDPEKDV